MNRLLGLLVTYRCNALCDSCCVNSGPGRRERMSREEIMDYVRRAAAHPEIDVVVFTGGEPLLLYDDVRDAIALASSLGLRTRIVTNGWWATDDAEADRMLGPLVEAGLQELNMSMDDYHTPYIPPENIRYGVHAALRAGIRVAVATAYDKESTITPDNVPEYLGLKAGEFGTFKELGEGPDKYRAWVTNSPVLPVARGGKKIPLHRQILPQAFANQSLRGIGCPMVFRQPTVRPNGQVQACCGFGATGAGQFIMGDAKTQGLDEVIQDGENDLLLFWMALEGPYSIADFIRQKDPSVKFRSHYVNICDLCVELFNRKDTMRVLAEHAAEKFIELNYKRSFYKKLAEEDSTPVHILNG